MENILSSKLNSDSSRFCDITEDLIIEILLRLPVNSILKFRCVSKAWRSFISSKRFVESQLNLTATNNTEYVRIIVSEDIIRELYCRRLPIKQYNLNVLLNKFDDDDHKASEFYYPMSDYEACSFNFIGSYNGLCCAFICIGTNRTNDEYKKRLFVWNPSTRKSRECTIDGFHTYDSVISIGFGFDGVDYKVLAMYWDCRASVNSKVVRLYSSRTNAWKTIDDDDDHKLLQPFVTSIHGKIGSFANGKLYWMRVNRNENKEELFYFDLGSEAYGTVEVPQVNHLLIQVLRECLYLISYHIHSFDLWVLKQHGSKDELWNKMITITMVFHYFPEPVWMTGEGEILILEQGYLEAMMFYDPKSNSVRQSNINLPPCPFISSSSYVTSLVSPFPDDYDLKQDDKSLAG